MNRPRIDATAAVALFGAALGFLFWFDPLARPVLLDPATWDYMAISLSDGLIPYRDIFLHKTPGAVFLGAAGATIGPWLGLEPVQGAHLVFVVLGASAPALLYLLSRPRLGIGAAVAAAAFLLGFDQWVVASLEGVRPKVATVVFGLAALLAAQRRRPLSAGVLSSAATLCWQPGLAFACGAVAELAARGQSDARHANAEDRSARLPRLLALALGATLPLALLLGWLALHGALLSFFRAALAFNTDYIALHAQTPARTLGHIYALAADWNAAELLAMPVAVVGLIARRHGMSRGLGVTAAAYTTMVFVNFQAWPDTILLAPLVAIALAAGLDSVLGAALPRGATVVLVTIAVVSALTPHSRRLAPPIDYHEQARFMLELDEGVGDHDAVLVVSLPEYLIHSGRRSLWRWPYMWFGVDRIAAQSTAGGFDALLAELEEADPPLMLVARRWSGPLRRRFERWAAPRYTRERIFYYPHTVRPINVYRRIRNGP